MKIFRIGMFALAAVYAVFAALLALVGSFADGGEWWEYITLIAVQPIAAAALIVLVAVSRPSLPDGALWLIAAALAAAVCLNAFSAAAIAQGITRGQWWLPLAFGAIPALGLVYAAALMRTGRRAGA